jgi:hypothetical protein
MSPPIDYNSFNEGNSANRLSPNNRWWLEKNSVERAQGICQVVNTLAQADSKRQTQYQISARLYGNVNLMGINGLSLAKLQSAQANQKDKITYNIVQSGIDTICAKLSKNKPKPLFLTSGGNWKLHKQAEGLSKFADGIFYENKAYTLGREMLRDAAVIGDGFVKVFRTRGDNPRVRFMRVLCSELYVDQMEAFYGRPRQLYHVVNVDRAVLLEMFPEKREIILNMERARADLTGAYLSVSDQVTICEAWHLPSGEGAGDGMRVIATEKDELESEKWDKDYFPFARLPWTSRLYGYWAQSGAEQIQNIQLEINKILWVIQRSYHMAGSFKILMEHGSKIVKEHFTNEIGTIVGYTGVKPDYVVPPIVPPEIYAHLANLETKAFNALGVSQLSAAGTKPQGLDAAVALREMQDIESERFEVLGQQYEDFYLDLIKLAIAEVEDIYQKKKKYEVQLPGRKFLETIDWKDIRLEDDEYLMKIFPVSSLPNDPSGRLQTITEYIQAGFMTPRAGRRLLDFPDLESAEHLANAQEDWIHEVCEKIIEDGEPYTVEPEDDLTLFKELILQYIAYAKGLNVDESKLDLLRNINKQVTDMITAATPPQLPAPTPQANPQPTPTSQLVPNVPGGQAA